MSQNQILHPDFKPAPYWWEAYKPVAGDLVDVPRSARVAIVGGGYAGLSCAIELADSGIDACVLEAAERRRRERRGEHRQELHRQGPRPGSGGR